MLEELQQNGVALKDIAILVRKNDEGQRIANHLLHHKNSGKAKPGCHYDVVSNESLRIDGASSVNLLLGAMRYLLNPEDSIARAQLGYEFSRLHKPERDLSMVFAVANQAIFENNLPEAFTDRKPALKKLSLIELTETLIEIFNLGSQQGELVYLQAFQDLVLDFYNRERNDLGAFLEWWKDNRHKKSVQISGDVNAAQILTIHKSKGLQFRYVIIPFCAWNMDHDNWQAPNLWVRSDKEPFSDAGYLPVRYSKILEQTYFAEYYEVERTRSYLDNLNLLYVALTRAEHGLMITAPHPDIRSTKNSIAALLFNSIHASEDLQQNWNEAEGVFRSGTLGGMAPPQHEAADHLSLSAYLSASWREKLVIRQSGANYFDDLEQEQREKISYGIHMHAVLSRMRYADEIETRLDEIILEGLITAKERNTLHAQLRELLAISEVGLWFSRHWKVQTEVPILLPGGGESRLDRLIWKDKKAIVIDFKTGEQKKDDNRQVLQYMETLRQMNFLDVDGFLLYLRDRQVVEVKAGGKQKVVKKVADKDQMSLGF
jgi:ATP-dependent helicase/nuclease subunit A